MKDVSIDYSTGTPIVNIGYSNLGRRQKIKEITSLPALKLDAEMGRPEALIHTLKDLSRSFEAETSNDDSVLCAVHDLLTFRGKGSWRIVEVWLTCGCLMLTLVSDYGEKQRVSVHGSKFPRSHSLYLTFEGQRDEMTLSLLPCEVRCTFQNGMTEEKIVVTCPNDPSQRFWQLESHQKIDW